jgi:hypothetical protein
MQERGEKMLNQCEMEKGGQLAVNGAMTKEVSDITAGPPAPEPCPGQDPAGNRIVVTLIPQANDNLRQLQVRTSLSRTDLVNRAISLYEFFDAQLRADQEMMLRDSTTGRTKLVRISHAPAGQAMLAAGPARTRRGRAGRASRQRRSYLSLGWLLRPAAHGKLLPPIGLTGQEVRTP